MKEVYLHQSKEEILADGLMDDETRDSFTCKQANRCIFFKG